MNDPEEWMKTARLDPPRPELDRRMAQLFAAPPRRPGVWLNRPVPLWGMAGAMAIVAMAAYYAGGRRQEATVSAPQAAAPVVYIIQDSGSLGGAVHRERVPAFLSSPDRIRIEIDGQAVDTGAAKDAI